MKDLIQTIASMAATARAEFSASKTWSTSDDGAMSCMTIRVPVAMLNRIDELAAAAFIKPHSLSLDESDLSPAPPMLRDGACPQCREHESHCNCNGQIDKSMGLAKPDDAVTALMDADWKLPETSQRTADWPFPVSVR